VNLRLAAATPFRGQAARLADRLTARGFTVTVVDADSDAELRLTSAEGLAEMPTGPAAIIGLTEPRDALVTGPGGAASLSDLPAAARVALAGILRAEMLGVHRPELRDLRVEDAREAADLLDGGDVDAWIAPLGVVRAVGLGDTVREIFEPTSWATAVGRGSSVLRAQVGDEALAEILSELDEPAARAALRAEQVVLDVLGVGPDAAVGVLARPHGPLLRVRALIPARAGQRLVRAEFSGHLDDPTTAGRRIGEELIERGGLELLAEAASA
jgi:hydroxymethylbilane synthase